VAVCDRNGHGERRKRVVAENGAGIVKDAVERAGTATCVGGKNLDEGITKPPPKTQVTKK